MNVEIEAKMKVDDLETVRRRLAEVGAVPAGDVTETNTFFDSPDRTLLAEDRGLRLRRRVETGTSDEKYILTHKGPRTYSRLKAREEIEVEVADGPGAATLLEALGFGEVLSFEKRRQSWMLDRCHVELDELPHLGTYVEIEGPGEDAVLAVRDKLNLGDAPLIKASYIALLTSHLQETGEPAKDVRFADEAA